MVTTQEAAERVEGNRLLGLLADVGLVAFGLVIVGLYSSWNRPIWLDEYLFFAFGAMSLLEVLTAIHGTATEINHGQTGLFILADWALLQVFGASGFAIRLPSLLAGGLLLFSAVLVLRFRGFGRPWQYLVMGLLACQAFLMYFVGEARPYLLLAATSVAALAYYQLDPARRRTWIGWFLVVAGIWIGALNHPYFPLMLGVVLVVSMLTAWRSGWLDKGWKSVVGFADPVAVLPAAGLYLVVGILTWLPSRPEFGYDPYSNMGSREVVIDAFWRDHFGVLWAYRGWFLAFAALVVVVLALSRFRGGLEVVAPLVLGVLALGTSFVVSAASYLSDYWILQRQWVAGIALFAVAVVWFIAQLSKSSGGRFRWVGSLPAVLVSAVVVVGLGNVWTGQMDRLASYAQQQEELRLEQRSLEQLVADGADWPYLANVNISRGGPVWPVFTDWYSRQAGMREE